MEATTQIGTRQHVGRLAAFAFLIGIVPQAMVEAAITAALPEAAKDLGLNGEFVAQMLMGMGALGLALGALISGWLLERLGSRRTYLASALALAVAGAVGLVVRDNTLLFASRVLCGLAGSCIATTCMWGITTEFGQGTRAKSFGFAGALGGTAAIVSVISGGYVTQHFGWRYAFAQYIVLAAVLLPLVLAGVRQQRPEGVPAGQPGYFRRVLPLYLQILVIYLVIGMFSMQLPFLLNADGMTDASMRSLIQSIPGIGVIVGGAVFGPLRLKAGAMRTLATAIALFTLGLLVMASNHAIPLVILGAALCGLCMGLTMPYYYHAVSERVGPASAGRYLGYLSACTFLGGFANPLVFEPLKGALGIRAIFLVGAGLIVALVITVMVASRRTADAPS